MTLILHQSHAPMQTTKYKHAQDPAPTRVQKTAHNLRKNLCPADSREAILPCSAQCKASFTLALLFRPYFSFHILTRCYKTEAWTLLRQQEGILRLHVTRDS